MGFVAGPVIVSVAMANFGVKGSLALMFPAYIMAAVLLIMIRRLPSAEKFGALPSGTDVTDLTAQPPAPDQASAPAQASVSGQTSAPDPATDPVSATPPNPASAPLQAEAAAAVDPVQKDNWVSFAKLAVFVLFRSTVTFVKGLTLATLMLIPLAFAINLCFSTMVTIGQAFLPNHIGFASGVTMGMGISVGGVAAPILGRVSDLYGLTTAFYIIIALACLTAIPGYLIPRHQRGNANLSI